MSDVNDTREIVLTNNTRSVWCFDVTIKTRGAGPDEKHRIFLGDREAQPGEAPPRQSIPLRVFKALVADKVQGPMFRALADAGDIGVNNPLSF